MTNRMQPGYQGSYGVVEGDNKKCQPHRNFVDQPVDSRNSQYPNVPKSNIPNNNGPFVYHSGDRVSNQAMNSSVVGSKYNATPSYLAPVHNIPSNPRSS